MVYVRNSYYFYTGSCVVIASTLLSQESNTSSGWVLLSCLESVMGIVRVVLLTRWHHMMFQEEEETTLPPNSIKTKYLGRYTHTTGYFHSLRKGISPLCLISIPFTQFLIHPQSPQLLYLPGFFFFEFSHQLAMMDGIECLLSVQITHSCIFL